MTFSVFVRCLLLVPLIHITADEVPSSSDTEFRFTSPLYNVSIPENSVAKVYASPASGEARIGIWMPDSSYRNIRYKIVGGDSDKFFKADHKTVGDFCFLYIRTRTGNNHVLNRERKDKYILEVRGTAVRGHNTYVQADTLVVVTVLDTNDLNPLFYPTEYNVTIFEDTPVHQSILKVIAEDADLGRNGEIYYSFLEETDQFAIHPISGVISLSRPLRYNEGMYHDLTVQAQDRGTIHRPSGTGALSKARVKVRVKQVNFFKPEIKVRRHPQIVENSNADIYAIVNVVDKDSGIHGMVRSLEIVDGDPDGHFRIRPTSQKGEYNIEVLKLLDRETTPQGYTLQLKAVDRGIPPKESYKSVPVQLADLNDNAPIFNKEIYEVKVPENAPINTPLIRLKVSDADEGKNAQVFLEIVGGNEGGEFHINPETGMLYTAVPLDAETKSFYSLTVSAIDQGNVATRKQSSAKVKIYVEDTNDNDPIFDKPEMTVWIDENMPAGSSVTTVRAKDRDRGENAYISYLIANLVKVPFEVDHFSGVIKTTQLLDYESMRREYVLRVRASDWGLPYRRQTEMQLTVKVKDINDNRPQFEKIECTGHVPRATPIGAEIITLSAIDFDAGNIISYRIVSGNEDGCFSMEQTSGTISVSCDLTDVRVPERELNVTATDGTHFADIARVQFKLVNTKRNVGSRILDDDTGTFDCKDTGVARRLTEVLAAAENNNKPPDQEEFAMMPTRYGQNIHSPEFVDFPIEIKVNESVALGTTLIKLKARDRDLGYNGKLIYGISGGDEHSVFCLDMDSGELKVIGYLDRERESEYLLNVSVYDLGKPQKSASRMLPITVLDINDNAPKFEKSIASFRVTENAKNGTIIFKANATDADFGDNAKITYSLVTDTKDFSVDKQAGTLTVSNTLDRERQEVYELKIRAIDGGGKGSDYPPLYSDALVRITVDDINDNAPKFSLSSYSVKIREDIPKGSVVAVVSASDPDLGAEGEIEYTIEDTDSDGTFKIDKLSGTIRTTKLLDFEERQVHSLLVIANDRGNPSLSSEVGVTVNVVDVNENMFAPQFSDFVLQGSVLENKPYGTEVMVVTATDNDPPGEDSRIEYSIRGGDGIGIFTIDNKGTIKTAAILDVETKSHYWLTVFAQDHGVVPLFSSVEIYIEVLNENDNVPLSKKAVYYASVPEDSPSGWTVVQLEATDNDVNETIINYKIITGNPGGFFHIDSSTGLITTTTRRLDRESQDEYILEVQISDNGSPILSSTTRVVVTVEDVNDNGPEFEDNFYKVQIPASSDFSQPAFQNDAPADDFDGADAAEDEYWETFSADDVLGLERVFRALAYDKDIGRNAQIHYSIKSGKGRNKFKIDNSTGMIYATKGLEPGSEYELNIKATDDGDVPKSSTCRLQVSVIPPPPSTSAPPIVKQPQQVQVTENDIPGFLVTLIQASDPDGDVIWFDIVDGDPRNEFYIGRLSGNILLGKQLDYETQKDYSLNISITDAVNIVYTQLNITVIDNNDHRPEFSESQYKVEISESVAIDTEILQLHATDEDNEGKLVFSLHAARNKISLQTFKIDSITGSVTLAKSLDRESLSEHLLTVMVRDGGTPSKRNYARVLIIVHDQNDHTPQFSEKILEGKVFESASIGSAVLRAYAIDHDKGENARVTYSISSGNVGNVFSIDPDLGIIQVARDLDISVATEYTLYIRATDHGQPSLSTTIPAHIMITMADNAPPKFVEKEVAAEIYEDKPLGSFVAFINVRSMSSLQYEIMSGNTGDVFMISPSTGVIITQKVLDYETVKFYNLTVRAVNMASASATGNVIIHILDRNDNVPKFVQDQYSGTISEAAGVHSLILTNTSDPLVIKALDADSEVNGLLHFDIVEILPRRYFQIDSNTGAIRTIRLLDHETHDKFSFHVTVSDMGSPKLSSETTARVDITVTDVNDCPPIFEYPIYNVTLLLPTYKNVAIIKLNATDKDTDGKLKFDIIDGNKHKVFDINSRTDLITVLEPENMKSSYKLQVRVSDGKFSSVTKVYIRVEQSENSGLTFQKTIYEGSIVENTTKIHTVCVVNVLGSALNEHLEFRILNPTNMFAIGLTSGVIRTTGVRFDREAKENYELIVEARSHMPEREKPRVAHVIVNVTVLDINDNCPMFVNLPYYAVVSVDDEKGSVIAKVHAIDMDSNENGEVRYELIRGHGELFKVQRESGDIEIKQNLEGHNREYELEIAAYDKGITPCRTDVKVFVKVIDRSMPVFKKQFYSEIVPENVELHSPLALSVQAESPLKRKLIYSIVKGNELEEFALDFNTAPDSNTGPCVISVVDELDYEQQQQYELIVRATDSVSGVYAEVPVSIVLQDVNDCPPEFTEESYNISISEAAPFGTSVLVVTAKDNDTGINQKIIYTIKHEEGNNATDYFYIDEHDGTIYLKQSLDHERSPAHHFIVVATDQGNPSLSTTAHVWLSVLDMNDNPPKFEQPSYYCGLSVHAKRDQFVTIVSGSDPDEVDQMRLRYSIVAGNEQQTFSMDPSTGIITLTNLANFGDQRSVLLNVSVSDGVYTNFARVKVELLPANLHAPIFPDVILDVEIPENQDPGYLTAVVKATDKDFGKFGTITYSIQSDLLLETFSIDKHSGKIVTRSRLDREKQKMYEIPVMATDGGDRSGFLTVRVKVTDQNDNAPKFNLREYKGCISSNFTLGQFFLKIHATDLDEGLSAQIRYSIYKEPNSEVGELFDIETKTGRLYLIKDVNKFEGQVFQFFVRATDGGQSPKHSDVPVNVLIKGPKERPPIFERKDDKFFLSENSPTGTVITTLKMVSNISVTYKILSGSEDNPQFTVDNQGQLILSRPLNFESQVSHLIGVLAETDSSPPLTALVEITLQVLDENDNAPHFESNPYVISLAENTEEGTSILKVTAHDDDQGTNGEVRYAFGSDSGDAINVFSVDALTGWITTLVPLDRETKSDYKFSIMATDNKHTARATIIIKLKDYNDSPTLFKRKKYEGAVYENALPGTVILKLDVSDADVNLVTPIDFYIVSGDPSSHFRIRQTGELYVVKELDRETVPNYDLEIIVTDGLFTDTTKVHIKILDINDNPPYCLKYRYRQVLSEGILPGSFVLGVLASDIDDQENSKLRYILTGDGSENFSLDKDSGHLKTIAPLDREKSAKYNLIAHVQDREHSNWECSSQIELVISDLNDNAPLFSLPYYSVALPEDVEVGTLVTKIHATDADIGINRKIKYSFIDSFNNHFKMAADSGIVTLAKPLDREIRAMYNLTVQAVDQGTPQMSSVASLIVNVQDINDNPPEFASKYYFATVPEINSIGTEIAHVLATSKDTGVNAEVYYSIIGGNEHRKFVIDNKTGVVTLSDMLDYERAKDYFLTIQAIDGGTPPLSNVATLNITVTDCNDNAPVFGQSSYTAKVREDAMIGDKITQVTATDLDSDDNGRVTYSIIRGDNNSQFSIDEDTGFITVTNKLDRELISSYILEILARDNGLPVLSRQVLVNIEIADANDNPPLFSQTNYTAVVQEDKPIGYPILKFTITDADISPNTSPYTFDFRAGNDGNIFRLEQDGMLRTATKFNHKIKNTYLLQIRVFDNGTPPLYSDTVVVVKVIEESQYPPIITPLEININSFLDEYPGGIIGKVYASDQDEYDSLTYSLSPTSGLAYPTHELFKIDRIDGTLTALPRLDVGEYRLNVSVTDGKYYSHAIVKIIVEVVTENMLDGAVVIRFREVSPESFVLSHRKGFVRAVRNAMNCRLKDVIIVSIQPSNDFEHLRAKRQITKDLDVLFTVRKSDDDNYYSSEEVRKAINDNLEDLESSTKLVVEEIVRMKCTASYCQFGTCQDRYVIEPTSIKPISTEVTSFVSPKHGHRMDCICNEGYGGDQCDVVINECARSKCPTYKICIPDSSAQGFSCQCPEGFSGYQCDIDISKCHDESCYAPRNPMSLKGKSYSQYRIINKKTIEDQLSLSLRIRTMQPSGNLMYSSGKVDYNILEVVNGVIQYRFELGSGEGVVRVSTAYVSDGKWHEIRLERDHNNARLIVDGIHSAQGSAPGISDILNLQSDEMYLGAEVHQHPSILGLEDIQRGFTGCMDDIRIARISVPLHKSGDNSIAVLKRFANVEFSCDSNVLLPAGACGSQPCMNGGSCKETQTGFECLCHARFKGILCELDTDPCASSPCLYGGKCSATVGGDYSCDCEFRLSGKRCEYGKFCSPNPCQHGGVCEEGDDSPLCKCRFFTGDYCQFDLNECESSPCQNGGTCVNEVGSFRCLCPANTTGPYCGTSNMLRLGSISLGLIELIIIGVGILVIFIIILAIIIIYCKSRKKKRNNRQGQNVIVNETRKEQILLNSTRQQEMVEFKRGKFNNLEVQREATIRQPRPQSYAAAPQNENYNYNYAPMLNNFESIRSYGSAGDELENPPLNNYNVRNLNLNNQQNPMGNHCDSDKTAWAEQMHLAQSYAEKPKVKNDFKISSPVNCDPPNRLYGGRSNINHKSLGPTSMNSTDDDQRSVGSYHWDCSDWARNSQTPLANITEVPGSEIPDSSSFHSNESNESRYHHPHSMGPVNPDRDIETLNEDLSEFLADSECERHTASPSLNALDSSNEEYRFTTADSYVRHPNTYLPTHGYNIPSEAEGDCLHSPGADSDDVEPYGFPSNRNRRKNRDDDIGSVITALEERDSLLGPIYGSNSDMSTNLCEIEDSECESEQKPLNYLGVQQTSV